MQQRRHHVEEQQPYREGETRKATEPSAGWACCSSPLPRAFRFVGIRVKAFTAMCNPTSTPTKIGVICSLHQRPMLWHVQADFDGGDWENLGQVMELYKGFKAQARWIGRLVIASVPMLGAHVSSRRGSYGASIEH